MGIPAAKAGLRVIPVEELRSPESRVFRYAQPVLQQDRGRALPASRTLRGGPARGVAGSIERSRAAIQALAQCANFLRKNRLQPLVHADTAGAAREVADQRASVGAIASSLAAASTILEVLARHRGCAHNPRACWSSRAKAHPDWRTVQCMTAFLFQVEEPAGGALQALGGFATNGVNIVKLEAISPVRFQRQAMFSRSRAIPSSANVLLALEELGFFSRLAEAAAAAAQPILPAQGLGSADPSRHLRHTLQRQFRHLFIRIAPSILSADFAALGEEIEAITKSRRRLDPCRCDGWAFRAQPDDRSDGGEGAAQAQQADLRRASHDLAGRCRWCRPMSMPAPT